VTVLPGFDVAAVEHSGATLVSLVPTALSRIDPARFRTIVLGGSRPPEDRPSNCVTTYGMTETGSGLVYDGVPLDGVQIDITPGGEIRLRAPMLLRCYRDGTSPVDADGWFATGDIGEWQPDGRLHVFGRRGDLIISGGENVWPETVEAAIVSHPGVAEALVRGVEDADWGQLVEAVIVPVGDAPTLDSIRDHVKLRHPAFMAPKRLEIVESLPRTALGKLRRTTESGTHSGGVRHPRRAGRSPGSQPAADTPAPPSMT
jgi:O-succinylbenzoic acid--CoA ligase